MCATFDGMMNLEAFLHCNVYRHLSHFGKQKVTKKYCVRKKPLKLYKYILIDHHIKGNFATICIPLCEKEANKEISLRKLTFLYTH